ncbi:hypothetical protein GW626_05955 [Peribacillus muralis]|uniref:hypothetical protein n=1 Tax=Peribacillus muralis TaxID=264697 RepID=UPI001F4E2F01|nr:hypothetical protein [Peribacillus muralis]MCK1992826.1 hypothetical protein [Peribacillus muralis]MCK2013381.1 hypothetical protein [Peribacillus muralis]
MGYIVPVTQFDYIQYANRTVEAAGKVRIVEGTTPIQPIRFDQVMQEKMARFQEYDSGHHHHERTEGAATYKMQMDMRATNRLTASMTGKGGHFNEMI